MEILRLFNSYIIYLYIIVGIILLCFLISLLSNSNKLSRHINQNIDRVNGQVNSFNHTIDEYHTRISNSFNNFKKALGIFIFVRLVSKDYKKHEKKSLISSIGRVAKANITVSALNKINPF